MLNLFSDLSQKHGVATYLVSIDLTPFDFTIKKLPSLTTLYSYYLQLIHHTVWITELQYYNITYGLKGSNSTKELCRNTLTKKTYKKWPLSKDIF